MKYSSSSKGTVLKHDKIHTVVHFTRSNHEVPNSGCGFATAHTQKRPSNYHPRDSIVGRDARHAKNNGNNENCEPLPSCKDLKQTKATTTARLNPIQRMFEICNTNNTSNYLAFSSYGLGFTMDQFPASFSWID